MTIEPISPSAAFVAATDALISGGFLDLANALRHGEDPADVCYCLPSQAHTARCAVAALIVARQGVPKGEEPPWPPPPHALVVGRVGSAA